jgi:hypothetical protein
VDVNAASMGMKSKRRQEPCSVSPLPNTTQEQSEIPHFPSTFAQGREQSRTDARNEAGESDSTMDRFFHYGCSGAYS